MKRAQIKQVFSYMMALLVIGFLIVMAIRMGGDLFQTSCDVEDTQFLVGFQKAIDRAARFGTVANPSVLAPCKYNYLCMFNESLLGTPSIILTPPTNNMDTQMSVIENSLSENIPYNVYLIEEGKDGAVKPIMLEERINTGSQQMICVRAQNGDFNFWVKGLGNQGILVYDQ